MKKMGTGRELYAALEKILSMQNILNLNACIAYPCEAEDPYLTRDSVQFHKRLGYQFAGKFHRCGCKFGRWYHMSWAEKLLTEPPEHPGAVIPFPQLEPTLVADILRRASE